MPALVRTVLLGNSFASRVQLPALRWAGGAEVVGIAGADARKAARTAREWSIPHATDAWRDLLELDPDLVIVTTPVHLHAPMVLAALETRAAILCEKPFALEAGEARVLADRAAGRLALIDHQLRWSPWRRRMSQLVREGFLGRPWSAEVTMRDGSKKRIAAPYSWWYDAERGGGTLGAIASHMIDALCVDFGPIESVRARLVTYVRERTDESGEPHSVTADEHATLWLHTHGGASVTVDANLMAPASAHGSWIEYVGDEGTLRLENETRLVSARLGETPREIDVPAPLPSFEELGLADVGIFARVLPLYLRDVVRAVAEGASELPGAATFADGLATLRVLDAARRSSLEEAWVPCSPRATAE